MDNSPSVIYHYTTQEGLLGIIENEKIFATNTKFLNDTKEFDFGINLLLSTLESLTKASNRSRYDVLIEKITYEMLCHASRTQQNSFITSFSEKKDLLSQWRAYTAKSTGYCIGFKFDTLFYPDSPQSCIVSKVKYEDENIQDGALSLINDLKENYKEIFHHLIPCLKSEDKEEINKWIDELKKLDKEDENYIVLDLKEYDNKIPKTSPQSNFSWQNQIRETKITALSKIQSFVETHKHNSFHEENEWRFITKRSNTVISSPKLKFRSGKSYLIPYVDVRYPLQTEKIIEEIIIGPCPHPEDTKIALEYFLSERLDYEVNVINSSIPFRSW